MRVPGDAGRLLGVLRRYSRGTRGNGGRVDRSYRPYPGLGSRVTFESGPSAAPGSISRTNNLGNRDGSTGRLEQAVDAFRAVLTLRTRERAPIDWAMPQNNLGTALLALGRREVDAARLKEAVNAYGAALAGSTRGRRPLNWAATQNTLRVPTT